MCFCASEGLADPLHLRRRSEVIGGGVRHHRISRCNLPLPPPRRHTSSPSRPTDRPDLTSRRSVCEWLDVVVNSIESITLPCLTTTSSKEAKSQVQLSLHDNALNCIIYTHVQPACMSVEIQIRSRCRIVPPVLKQANTSNGHPKEFKFIA